MVSTHSYTMTQSTCADYMLKFAVPWYRFMSDMLLPYFLKLPCVNMVHGTHPQQGVQLEWMEICHSLWTIIMPLV